MMEMMIITQRMEPKKVPFVVPMILLNMDDPQRLQRVQPYADLDNSPIPHNVGLHDYPRKRWSLFPNENVLDIQECELDGTSTEAALHSHQGPDLRFES